MSLICTHLALVSLRLFVLSTRGLMRIRGLQLYIQLCVCSRMKRDAGISALVRLDANANADDFI